MRFVSRLADAKLPDEIVRQMKGKFELLRGNRIRYLGWRVFFEEDMPLHVRWTLFDSDSLAYEVIVTYVELPESQTLLLSDFAVDRDPPLP